MQTTTTTWDEHTPAQTPAPAPVALDSLVEQSWLSRKLPRLAAAVDLVKSKIAAYTVIGSILATSVTGCTSCKPEPDEFRHTITSVSSSPDGTAVVAWDDGEKVGSASVFSGKYDIGFTTENPTETLDSIVGRKKDFKDVVVTNVSVKDVKTVDINLGQKIFWLYGAASTPSATLKVYDNGAKLEELVVGTNGAFQSKNLTLPSDAKIDSVVVTAPGRDKRKLENYAVAENANKVEFVLDLTAYDHWFSNSSSTPGTHAEWFKNGVIVMNADVAANGSYLTGKWTTTTSGETIDSVIVTKNGYNKLKLVNVNAAAGNNDLQLVLGQTVYSYRFVGNATTPNGASVAVYEGGANIANGTVSSSSYVTNNWSSTLSSMNIDSVVVSYPGFATQRFLNVPVVPGDNTKNATLAQLTYPHSLTINIFSSEAGEGKKVRVSTTSIDGVTYAVVNQSLTHSWTDNNPTTNVTYDIMVDGPGHPDVGPVTKSVGASLIENRTLVANDFVGDVAYNVKDGAGQNVSGALVSATQGKTGTTGTNGNVTLAGFVIDENVYSEPVATNVNHAITKIGYTPKNGSASINSGANSVNEVIQQIINSYNIHGRGHLIGAVVSGLPDEAMDYLKAGSIRLTTKNDNVAHDVVIGADGHFNGDVVGAYAATDSVYVTFVNNPLSTTNTFSFLDASKVASVGKIKNDDGTYVSSIQEARFVSRTARTVLGKLAGKDLTFVAFSDQAYTLPDDLMNIRGPPNHGIVSYVLPDVTFVNDTINPNTGLPISAQNKIDQQNAIDFLAAELTTRTGLTLVNAYKIKSDNTIWSNFVGKCIIYKSSLTPTNGKNYVTPTTFNESDAHTRPTDHPNLIITEGSEGQNCTYDLIVGHGANQYILDGTGNIIGYSWQGDVAAKTAYLFPEAFFKKK